MFERYTEKARRVIFFARYEASAFGSPVITTEHVLLALIREDNRLIARALASADAVGQLESKLREALSHGKWVPTSVDLPLDNPCKRVLAYAAEEAARLNHRHIGAEHLLLGLLREKGTPVAKLLSEFNADLDRLRVEFEAILGPDLGRGRPQAIALPGRANVEFLDDRSGTLIARSLLPYAGLAPRKGEKVVLEDETREERIFSVVDVRYVFGERTGVPAVASHELTKILVYVTPIERGFSGPRAAIPDTT